MCSSGVSTLEYKVRKHQSSFWSQDGRIFYRNLQARRSQIHYTSTPLGQTSVRVPLRYITPQAALQALADERSGFLPEAAMELSVIDGKLIFFGTKQDSDAILPLLKGIEPTGRDVLVDSSYLRRLM